MSAGHYFHAFTHGRFLNRYDPRVYFVSHEGGILRHTDPLVKKGTQEWIQVELTTCCAAEIRSRLAEISRKRASGCDILDIALASRFASMPTIVRKRIGELYVMHVCDVKYIINDQVSLQVCLHLSGRLICHLRCRARSPLSLCTRPELGKHET